MKKLVNDLIEKVESFDIKSEYWEELKLETLKELERNPAPDNQVLWLCIKRIAGYIENYVG